MVVLVDINTMYDHYPYSQPTPKDSSANWKDALLYVLGPLAMLALGLLADYLKRGWP